MEIKGKKVIKTKDDYLYNGLYYDDLENLLHSVYFNFCCCGNPGESLRYIYKCFKHLALRDEMDYKDWKKKGRELFPESGSEFFMWYYFSEKGFTEHGSSVPGWLSDLGREVMSNLRIFLKENI
jgi:hypothetical protein